MRWLKPMKDLLNLKTTIPVLLYRLSKGNTSVVWLLLHFWAITCELKWVIFYLEII